MARVSGGTREEIFSIIDLLIRVCGVDVLNALTYVVVRPTYYHYCYLMLALDVSAANPVAPLVQVRMGAIRSILEATTSTTFSGRPILEAPQETL
jgi:hypothetical protein